jgi:hypothetical protein
MRLLRGARRASDPVHQQTEARARRHGRRNSAGRETGRGSTDVPVAVDRRITLRCHASFRSHLRASSLLLLVALLGCRQRTAEGTGEHGTFRTDATMDPNSIQLQLDSGRQKKSNSTAIMPAAAASSCSSSSSSSSSSDASVVAALPSYVLPLTTAQMIYTASYCEENCYKLCQTILQRLPRQGEASSDEESKSSASSAAAAAASSVLSLRPPPALAVLPSESTYSSLAGEQVFVVFLSNAFSSVRLFKQRAGDRNQDGGIIWDYHVILIHKPPFDQLAKMCKCGHSQSPADLCPCIAYVYDADTTLPFPCSLDTYARGAFRSHLAAPTATGSLAHTRRNERLFRVIGGREFLATFASDRSHMLAPVALVDAVVRAKGEEGVMREDDGASRMEISQEVEARRAEQSSWNASPVKERVSNALDDVTSKHQQYLAPPPPYPCIRPPHSSIRMNLDEFRFFRHPDSGRGVVMNEREFLEFGHVQIEPRKATAGKGTGRR